MTARLYAATPNARPAKVLRGQALQVWTELQADTTPRLATAIDANVGPLYKTRQDTLRVTLYYLLVFKKQGIVTSSEPVVTAPVVAEPVDHDAVVLELEESR